MPNNLPNIQVKADISKFIRSIDDGEEILYFKDDEYFPESLWGKKQREARPRDIKIDEFSSFLARRLRVFFG